MSVRAEAAPGTAGGSKLKWAIHDAKVVTRRNLIRYQRVPTLLVFSTIQPVMFVLLFRYVFGGAVPIPGFAQAGLDYVDYLIPGILVQTAVFGATQTGVGLAEDLGKGMIDRFRSLPMARSAVLAGRTISDTVRNVFVVLLMIGVGYLVGFSFHAGFLNAVAGIGLAVLFGHAISWVSAWIGLAVRDVETAQVAGFLWVFPLTFASSAFVPTESMPGWLQAYAEHQPVTATVNAMRALALPEQARNIPQLGLDGSPWTHVLWAMVWIVGILLVFAPLAIRRYRKVA